MKVSRSKLGGSSGAKAWWARTQRCFLLFTIVSGLLIFYYILVLRVFSNGRGGGTDISSLTGGNSGGDDVEGEKPRRSVSSLLGDAAHKLTDRLKSAFEKCPSCQCSTNGAGSAMKPASIDAAAVGDPDAWLDTVGDQPPPMLPSHYAMVHGMEPWERPGNKVWELHTIPTDDWYERAKKATDRCDLEMHQKIIGAENGLDDKVVWVSALFDLKRGEAGMGDFTRSMEEYYRRFQMVLDRGFQMVIFIPTEFEEHLRIDYNRVKVIYMNATDLKWYFPYYDRLQAIRTSKLWQEQGDAAGWLAKSPQARLEGYNPLVMIKLKMLRDAARLNPWGTRYHMWMDAGHLCAGQQSPTKMNMYRKLMSQGMMVTHWPYGTTTEVHGMTDKAMHLYIGTADDPLLIVRGGIFGGQLPHIECVLKAYMIALHQTLTDGYVGTEECIWAMIFARFPHLFGGHFDNNSLGNHGDNCASFQKNLMEEEEIEAGKRKPFISEPIPAYPSWWTEAMAKGSSATGKEDGGKVAVGTGSTKKKTSTSTLDTLVRNGAIVKRSKTAAINR